MKAKWFILGILVIVSLTSASRCGINFSGIVGSKNYITRDFKVTDFDKINVSAVANINYTQSKNNAPSLSIYGPDNIVDLVDVGIENNTLRMSMKKKNIKKGKLTITISSPNLYEVMSSGVGNFSIPEPLTTTSLNVTHDGVGKMQIDQLSCTDFKIYSLGVGDATIGGQVENATLVAQGVGSINASALKAKSLKAIADGVGNISCHVTDSLYARINGVGNISYTGDPAKKDLMKNGIGKIKQE